MRSFLLLVLLLAVPTYADELSTKLSALGFVEKNMSDMGEKDWRNANYSNDSFFVSVTNDIDVTKSYPPKGATFHSGVTKYTGKDNGEWGGGLYVNEHSEPIFEANIKALIPVGQDLYIISGLAHMTYSGGAIHVIRGFDSPSRPVQVTLLPDAPSAVSVDKNNRGKPIFIMAGSESLMSFVPDESLKVIENNAFWHTLYPTSVAHYKKSYIIGIRSGLAVVTPMYRKNEVRYFVPM